eukprot:2362914-Rhodomonas_salina.2
MRGRSARVRRRAPACVSSASARSRAHACLGAAPAREHGVERGECAAVQDLGGHAPRCLSAWSARGC